jgi:hypothetical protein
MMTYATPILQSVAARLCLQYDNLWKICPRADLGWPWLVLEKMDGILIEIKKHKLIFIIK